MVGEICLQRPAAYVSRVCVMRCGLSILLAAVPRLRAVFYLSHIRSCYVVVQLPLIGVVLYCGKYRDRHMRTHYVPAGQEDRESGQYAIEKPEIRISPAKC